MEEILAQMQALVQSAYSKGQKDGMAAAAAPLLALEGTLSQELDEAQAAVQGLLNPPAPSES